MQDRLMKRTAVFCTVFTLTAMGVMLYFASNKIIVVADVAQDEVVRNEQEKLEMTEDNTILFDRSSAESEYFYIPLPETVKPEEVTVENHYMDQELWVSAPTQDAAETKLFYEEHPVAGNAVQVLEGHYEVDKGILNLRFRLTGVYEYRSVFQDNRLCVEFLKPKDVYDKVIVVDAAYGGEDYGIRDGNFFAKDVTLDVARHLKDRMDTSDIKVYYTRMDDSNPTDRRRIQLADMAEADMLIRIEVAEAEDVSVFGTETVCNSRYFIPDFGSVDLADVLERKVVESISGRAVGLVEAGQEDTVVLEATVPAAAVRVGYMTNEKEGYLLRREDYLDKIAEGIYQAVQTAYEQMGEE